jgi:negative regulator of genetic competence, sporulation and motility
MSDFQVVSTNHVQLIASVNKEYLQEAGFDHQGPLTVEFMGRVVMDVANFAPEWSMDLLMQGTPLNIEVLRVGVDQYQVVVTDLLTLQSLQRQGHCPYQSQQKQPPDVLVIGTFDDLDVLSEVCHRLDTVVGYHAHSFVYKVNGQYVFGISQSQPCEDLKKILSVVSEFTEPRVVDVMIEAWYEEHGERILASGAMESLTKMWKASQT